VHTGPSTVLARLSREYYIPGVKRLLKKISYTCVICQCVYTLTSKQLVGELPASRVQPARPFSTIGVDFGEPISFEDGNLRKPSVKKGYICVYICFSVKAAYLNLVSDLSADAFLGSMRHFVCMGSRRMFTGITGRTLLEPMKNSNISMTYYI